MSIFITLMNPFTALGVEFKYTVDPRFFDFDYLELPLISKSKSDHCFIIEI